MTFHSKIDRSVEAYVDDIILAGVLSTIVSLDLLFLDSASNLARYVEYGAGEVTYLTEDVCRHIMQQRRNDPHNPLRLLKYSPGHYEGVCWP